MNVYKFDEIERKIDKGIVLFGAGQNGIWCLDYLLQNHYKVKYFIDNSINLQGTFIKGIPVINYDDFTKIDVNLPVLITAKHAALQILELMSKYPLKMTFDSWFYIKHYEDYEKLVNLFYDEKSKLVLNNLINTMQSGNEQYCAEIAEPNQYFSVPNFFNTGNEVFVNLGAFVGDTIEEFINAMHGGFKHIYAFEIGKKQYKACNKRIKRLIKEWALDKKTITIEYMGIGNTEGSLHIKESDRLLSTSIEKTENKGTLIKMISLDKYFKDIPFSFLAVDIEGSEMDMLLGAKEILKKYKPKIALSVYHRPDDLIKCANFLYEINPSYKFSLRHHSSLMMDTTLYCYQ